MNRIKLDHPIAIRFSAVDQRSGQRRIADVHEGLATLFRYGIEKMRCDSAAGRTWRFAWGALTQAKKAPTPRNIARATRSVERIARRSGMLISHDESNAV